MRAEALVAAKHAGGVREAMGRIKDNHSPLYLMLETMLIMTTQDLFWVEPGTKLRHCETKRRYIMTTTRNILVDLDSGELQAGLEVILPLEIYHYAK